MRLWLGVGIDAGNMAMRTSVFVRFWCFGTVAFGKAMCVRFRK